MYFLPGDWSLKAATSLSGRQIRHNLIREFFVSFLWITLCYSTFNCCLAQTINAYSESEKLAIVDKHNFYRFQDNLNPPATDMQTMVWDETLAQTAANYVDSCTWGHNSNRGNNVGENLYASSGASNVVDSVVSWASEKEDYSFDTFTCASGKVCGHYTQVIWASTNKVGCARKTCSSITGLAWSGTIVVCDYSPAGNYVGEKPYTPGSVVQPNSTVVDNTSTSTNSSTNSTDTNSTNNTFSIGGYSKYAMNKSEILSHRSVLLDGVSEIPNNLYSSYFFPHGSNAFPIVISDDNKVVAVAGSYYGKGRVCAFGNGGYLNYQDANNAQKTGIDNLIKNCIKWTTNSKANVKYMLHAVGANPLLGTITGLTQYTTTSNAFDSEHKPLETVDLLIISLQDVNDVNPQMTEMIRNFLERGGGIITGLLGFYHKYQNDPDIFAGNVFFADFGVTFYNPWYASGKFLAATSDQVVSGTYNPYWTLDSIVTDKPTTIAATVLNTFKSQLTEIINSLQKPITIDSCQTFNMLGQVYVYYCSSVKLDAPFTTDSQKLCVRLVSILNSINSLPIENNPEVITAEKVIPGPTLNGETYRNTPSTTVQVLISTIRTGWQCTGYYALPGSTITLSVNSTVGLSRVVVGGHTDDISNKNEWPRFPKVSISKSINSVTFTTGTFTAFSGGIIYVDVSSKPLDFIVTLTGQIVKVPFWKKGVHTNQDWLTIRNYTAPFLEVEGTHFVMSVKSTPESRSIDDIESVADYWGENVMNLMYDLSQRPVRDYKERFQTDIEISAGYMHSGYPIMAYYDQDVPTLFANNPSSIPWGHYHELGHNFQVGHWTYENSGELTVNLFTLYLEEHYPGGSQTYGERDYNPPNREGSEYTTMKSTAPFKNDWSFAGQLFHMDIIKAFGWVSMKKFIASYVNPTFEALRINETLSYPVSDSDKRDQWLKRYSNIVNRNMAPLFALYNFPVSQHAIDAVSKLPSWMPNDFVTDCSNAIYSESPCMSLTLSDTRNGTVGVTYTINITTWSPIKPYYGEHLVISFLGNTGPRFQNNQTITLNDVVGDINSQVTVTVTADKTVLPIYSNFISSGQKISFSFTTTNSYRTGPIQTRVKHINSQGVLINVMERPLEFSKNITLSDQTGPMLCDFGFYGDDCSISTCFEYIGNDPKVCSGHGKCVGTDLCECFGDYFGEECNDVVFMSRNDSLSHRDYLLLGVSTIVSDYSSYFIPHGPNVISLFTSADNQKSVVVGASYYGKGRLVAFGNGGYLHPETYKNDGLMTFMRNAVKWVTKKKRKVQYLQHGVDSTFYKGLDGFVAFEGTSDAFDETLKPLQTIDLLVMSLQDLTSVTNSMKSSIISFLERGGAILTGALGWWYPYSDKYDPLSFPGNKLFAEMGISFKLSYPYGGFKASSAYSMDSNLYWKLDTCKTLNSISSITENDYTDFQDILKTVASTKNIALFSNFNDVAAKFVNSITFPSNTYGSKLMIRSIDILNLNGNLPLENNLQIKLAENFHGKVNNVTTFADMDSSASVSVTIQPSRTNLICSGYYALPGANISISVSDSIISSIVVGSQYDDVSSASTMYRWPTLYVEKTFENQSKSIDNFVTFNGGVIYFKISNVSLNSFTANITGQVVKVPHWKKGVHTNQDWLTIRNYPAPYMEIEGTNLILSVRATPQARLIEDIDTIATYWGDHVMNLCYDLSGQYTKLYKERIHLDKQGTSQGGVIKSGYPIYANEDQTNVILYPTHYVEEGVPTNTTSRWYYYDSIASTFQVDKWTYNAGLTSTQSMFTLLLEENYPSGKKVYGERDYNPPNREGVENTYSGSSQNFLGNWPVMSVIFHMELIKAFGWTSMKKFLRSYSDESQFKYPTTDQEKIDQWLIRYSTIVNRNIEPIFDKNKIPVSASAKTAVSRLKYFDTTLIVDCRQVSFSDMPCFSMKISNRVVSATTDYTFEFTTWSPIKGANGETLVISIPSVKPTFNSSTPYINVIEGAIEDRITIVDDGKVRINIKPKSVYIKAGTKIKFTVSAKNSGSTGDFSALTSKHLDSSGVQINVYSRFLESFPTIVSVQSCYGLSNTDSVCSGNGYCMSVDNCVCDFGWYGSQCDIPSCFGKLANETGVCSSVGTCIGVNTCLDSSQSGTENQTIFSNSTFTNGSSLSNSSLTKENNSIAQNETQLISNSTIPGNSNNITTPSSSRNESSANNSTTENSNGSVNNTGVGAISNNNTTNVNSTTSNTTNNSTDTNNSTIVNNNTLTTENSTKANSTQNSNSTERIETNNGTSPTTNNSTIPTNTSSTSNSSTNATNVDVSNSTNSTYSNGNGTNVNSTHTENSSNNSTTLANNNTISINNTNTSTNTTNTTLTNPTTNNTTPNIVNEFSTSEKIALLEKHNLVRLGTLSPPAAGMGLLVWDEELERVAAKYASKCVWSHNDARSSEYGFGYVGENLYSSSGSSDIVSKSVSSWASEAQYFTYPGTCQSGKACGHYTQLVWENTKRVGCAKKSCGTIDGLSSAFNGGTIVVCDYYPGGNWVGEKPYVALVVNSTNTVTNTTNNNTIITNTTNTTTNTTTQCAYGCGTNGVCTNGTCSCSNGFLTIDPMKPCSSCPIGKIESSTGASCVCNVEYGFNKGSGDCTCNQALGFIEASGSCVCNEKKGFFSKQGSQCLCRTTAGYTNQNGECIRSSPTCSGGCDNGQCYFLDSISNSTMCKCSPGYTDSQCSSCATGFILSDGKCKKVCPSEYSGDDCSVYTPTPSCVSIPTVSLTFCKPYLNSDSYKIKNSLFTYEAMNSSHAKDLIITSIKKLDSQAYTSFTATLKSFETKGLTCDSTCRASLSKLLCFETISTCSIIGGQPEEKHVCKTVCEYVIAKEIQNVTAGFSDSLCAALPDTGCFYGSYLPPNTQCYGKLFSSPLVCSSGRGECTDVDTCSCKSGYAGKECQYSVCFTKDSNHTGVCSGHGSCESPNNCKCQDGFSGLECLTPTCNGKTEVEGGCSFHGQCSNTHSCTCTGNFGGYSCSSCKSGFSGANCDVPICNGMLASDKKVCSGRGSCESVYGVPTCVCNSGFDGVSCQNFKCNGTDRTSASVCSQQGKCTSADVCTCEGNYDAKYYCSKCLASFNGEGCTNRICSEKETCNSRGTCNAEFKCECSGNWFGEFCNACADGWVGSDCSISCSPTKNCNGKGTCNVDGSCKCDGNFVGASCNSCKPGWYGDKCDYSIDETSFEFNENGDMIYGTIYTSMKKKIACSELIQNVASIGSEAVCSLNGDKNRVQIILGQNPSIQIGGSLQFKKYPSSTITTDTVNAIVHSTYYVSVSPNAVLSANPTSVSKACGKIYLDASNSVSLDRRKLIFSWSTLNGPSNTDLEMLDTLISSQTSSGVSFEATTLGVGSYTVQVVVTSSFSGEKTSASIGFTVSAETAPTLTIKEGLESSLTIGSAFVITPIISFPSCYSGSGPITYTYSLLKSPVTITLKQNNELLVFSDDFTKITEEGDYYFNVKAQQYGAVSVTLPFKVSAKALPLKVAFSIHDMQQSFEDNVQFSITKQDPSNPSDTSGQVSLSCLNIDTAQTCTGFNDNSNNIDQSSLVFNKLMNVGSYMFTVTFTKSSRTISSSVKVNVLDQSKSALIRISISPPENSYLTAIDPSKDLILQASSMDYLSSKRTFKWSSSDIEFDSSIIVDKKYLIIPKTLFAPGASYNVKVSVSDGSKQGVAEISFTMNSPPTVGVLEIQPSSGVALKDEFQIKCGNGWSDNQLPLSFKFLYKIPSESTWNLLSEKSEKRAITTSLPAGELEIKVLVYDATGAYSETTGSVSVTLPVDASSALDVLNSQQKGSVTVSSLTSVLSVVQSVAAQTEEQREALKSAGKAFVDKYFEQQDGQDSVMKESSSATASKLSAISSISNAASNLPDETVSKIIGKFSSTISSASDSTNIQMSTDDIENTRNTADKLKEHVERNLRSIKIFSQSDLSNLESVYNKLVNVELKSAVSDMPASRVKGINSFSYARLLSIPTMSGLIESLRADTYSPFNISQNIDKLPEMTNVENVKLIMRSYSNTNTTLKSVSHIYDFTILSTNNEVFQLRSDSALAQITLEASTYSTSQGNEIVCKQWNGVDFELTSGCSIVSKTSSGFEISVSSTGSFILVTQEISPTVDPTLPKPSTKRPQASDSTISTTLKSGNGDYVAFIVLVIPLVSLVAVITGLVYWYCKSRQLSKRRDPTRHDSLDIELGSM